MSYLNTPRICFAGTFTAQGPTKNNLLAARDYPEILRQKPDWDNNPPHKWRFHPDGLPGRLRVGLSWPSYR